MLTELGRSPVEVQRCSLSSGGPGLRSSGAHCAQTLAVEVEQCSLRSEAGEENWRESWRRGLARRLAKRIYQKVGKEDWRGEGEEEKKEGEQL